jgi:HEAT repeat protein
MGSSSTQSRTKGGSEVERWHLMLNKKSRSSLWIWLATAVLLVTVFAPVSAQSSSNLTALQKAIEAQRVRLNSDSSEDRRDALMRLRAIRVPEASRAALPGLADPNPMVRAVAASAVLSLPADESVTALLPLLTEKDEFVRREVAYALGHTRSRRATAPLIDRLQTDKEEGVRAAAIVALGEIGDDTAVVPLSAVLAPELSGSKKGKREKNVFLLRATASAFGRIRSRAGAPALIAALKNEKFDSDIRREAAHALGQIRDPSAIPALQIASSSADPYLATSAAQALKMIPR